MSKNTTGTTELLSRHSPLNTSSQSAQTQRDFQLRLPWFSLGCERDTLDSLGRGVAARFRDTSFNLLTPLS